ncbi:WhiB family transcriptional regulator [Rhodococcus sp. RDE2]|uniref:WhiB family transcriptional regulator n=1 Tax=Rhodococcus sp. RDE2 TaxID=2885078 RepID=UPI003B632D12
MPDRSTCSPPHSWKGADPCCPTVSSVRPAVAEFVRPTVQLIRVGQAGRSGGGRDEPTSGMHLRRDRAGLASTRVLLRDCLDRRHRIRMVGRREHRGDDVRAQRTPRSRRPPIPAVFAQIVDGRLTGAACVGRHALFDAELDNVRETPAERRARFTAAAAICRTCPVLEPCRVVADEAGRQAHGVWAATVRTTSRPDGRSREESSHAR